MTVTMVAVSVCWKKIFANVNVIRTYVVHMILNIEGWFSPSQEHSMQTE